MLKGILFLSGNAPNERLLQKYINEDDFIVCADRGYDLAVKLGYKPSVIIGDMDSVSKIPDDITVIKASVRKDETDGELCFNYLYEKGFEKIIIVGGLGGRYDHEFANIMLMTKYAKTGMQIILVDPPTVIYTVKDSLSLIGKKGDILSLFPVGGNAVGVKTAGLEYPLNNEILYYDTPRGISNVFDSDKASVCVKDGILIAMHISF